MEDFSLNSKRSNDTAYSSKSDNEMNMSVSGICEKEGKKIAYVSFSDGNRTAEGVIPECVVKASSGFDEAEIRQLEDYMRAELSNLKKMASKVNVFDAFMKK